MILMTVMALLCMNATDINATKPTLSLLKQENPFPYNLGVKIIASKDAHADITICCHGYGHNNGIIDTVNYARVIPGTLVSFNFPDYNINSSTNHHNVAYGTVTEILPLLYLIKRCVLDLQVPKINLYGFSAGGGAIINALAILNQSTYDTELKKVGITPETKKKIIHALEHGIIILDCPLKSWQEVGTLHRNSPFAILGQKNLIKPLDSLAHLQGLSLTILLHFQKPDEILANRDDTLFIERLKKNNHGTTHVVIGFDGGHNTHHKTLWNEYKKLFLK